MPEPEEGICAMCGVEPTDRERHRDWHFHMGQWPRCLDSPAGNLGEPCGLPRDHDGHHEAVFAGGWKSWPPHNADSEAQP